MATKTKSEVTELAAQIADQIRQDRRDISQKVEALFRQAFAESRELTFDELEFMRVDAGYDRQRIAQEKRRITRVVNHEMIVGTSTDRKKVDAGLTEAVATLEKRGPALEQQIAAAQSELASLTKTVDGYVRRKSEIEAGLQMLTELVCPSTAARCSAKRSLVKTTIGRQASDLKVEIDAIVAILDGDPNDSNYWVHLKNFDYSLAVDVNNNGIRLHRYADSWPAVAADLKAKLPSMKEELAKLQARFADELAEVETELRQYWR